MINNFIISRLDCNIFTRSLKSKHRYKKFTPTPELAQCKITKKTEQNERNAGENLIIISCNVAIIGEFINKATWKERFMRRNARNICELRNESRFIQNNNFLLINLKTNCLIKEMKTRLRQNENCIRVERSLMGLQFVFFICRWSGIAKHESGNDLHSLGSKVVPRGDD